MKLPIQYLAVGVVAALMLGVVIAVAMPQGDGRPFGEKYIAKLTVRVHRGSWDAWRVKIENVHVDMDKGIIALDMGKALSFWTGEYKVCAVALRNGFELDRDCQTIKLSPGDTKDVKLSLSFGEKPNGEIRITIYDEGGEIKDEKVMRV